MDPARSNSPALKKVLNVFHVWGICVGLVISGDYFGWNYGWNSIGPAGFIITTLVVAVLYICFTLSLTELASSIPNAGGPFTYANRAYGQKMGLVAAYATFIEFVFAPPAIALAIGSYIHFLLPSTDVRHIAALVFLVFTAINLLGIRESATFTLAVTLLAVAEILLFSSITLPHFEWDNLVKDAPPYRLSNFFESIPYAIWFYLGIEGIALIAEEVRVPEKNIPRGTIIGIITLVLLSLMVMLGVAGVGDWRDKATIDSPLPAAIGEVMGKANLLTKVFAGLGIFGLIASFHSIMLGYSRQIYAMSREKLLFPFFSRLTPKRGVPANALLLGSAIGIITVYVGATNLVITFSVLGAIVMYIVSLISLFRLRNRRHYIAYRTPGYPWTTLVALFLSLVALAAIIVYNQTLSIIFFGALFFLLIIVHYATRRSPSINDETSSD